MIVAAALLHISNHVSMNYSLVQAGTLRLDADFGKQCGYACCGWQGRQLWVYAHLPTLGMECKRAGVVW